MSIDREKVQQAAQKYVEKKRYDKAIVEYSRLVQADPNDARTLLKIGDLQSKSGAFPDAIATYDRVGNLYAAQGFALKAIAVYKQIRELVARHAPQLDERYAYITPKLADLYKQLGLVSDAVSALDEVATKLQARNKHVEAIEVFQKIVELDPTNPLPHLRLAEAFSRAQNVDGAVKEFGVAAKQLISLGRRDDAIKVLERSLHHRADPEQARIAAEYYVDKGTQQDGLRALSKLQTCFQADPRDLDTLHLLSRAFTLIGQQQKSIEVQKEMGRIARDAGDLPKFQQIVDSLMQLAPNDEVVRRLRGQADTARENGGLQTGERATAAQHNAPTAPPHPDHPAMQVPQPARSAPQMPPLPPQRHTQVTAEDVDMLDMDVEPDPSLPPPPMEAAPPPRPAAPVATRETYVTAPADHEREASDFSGDEARAAELLAEAESFRRLRMPERAIDTLYVAVSIAPGRIDINEALRDVLLSLDRIEEAVEAMMRIAGVFVELLDADAAARTLQDVLAYDPHNSRALEMLHELGFEIVPEEEEAPLPAYALEEAATEATNDPAVLPARSPGAYGAPGAEFDAGETIHGVGEPPLPSFRLDDRPSRRALYETPIPPPLPQQSAHYPTPPSPPPSVPSSGLSTNIEAALEQVDHYLSLGMLDDARGLLVEQLTRYPHNVLLLERMDELAILEQHSGGSGARERPGALQSFDLDESLEALGLEEATEADNYQVDVDDIFEQFKEGVAAQIGADDSQAHYDLGLAYKEMGLLADAIREFEVAAQDPARQAVCQSMIGIVEMERGKTEAALAAYLKGLEAAVIQPMQQVVLSYDAAALYETMKRRDLALQYYRKVMAIDPKYRNVESKIAALSSMTMRAVQSSMMDEDEFDTALDDLMSK